MDELQQVTNLFDVTTDCKVAELFCIIDEFCKHFDAENAGNLLEDNSGLRIIVPTTTIKSVEHGSGNTE